MKRRAPSPAGRTKSKRTTRVGDRAKRKEPKNDSGSESSMGLGPFSLRVLHAAGITTRSDLEILGPVRAFIAAKRVEPTVSLNLLWGIAGAVTNTHWTKLPVEVRSSLLLEYDAYLDAERALSALADKSLERKRGR